MFLKVDMDLSKVEFQVRDGQLWSKQDPYRNWVPEGQDPDEMENEDKPQALKELDILGTCAVCTAKNTLLVFHGTRINVLEIGPRKDMQYLSSIELPSGKNFLSQPSLFAIDKRYIALQFLSSADTVQMLAINLQTG